MAVKRNQKKIKKRTKDQYIVVVERLESKMDLMLEGHQSLRDKVDRLENGFNGLENGFDGLETRFDGLERRFDNQESRINNLENGQRLTLEYLERIEAELHGEVKTKVDMKMFGMLEKRVQRLENKFAKKSARAKV